MLMEQEKFDPLNNPLINYNYKYEINTGKDAKVQEYINKFPVNDDKGLLSYVERISVLKNGEWNYDTYIRSNNDITKDIVIDYINKIEKGDYEVQDISYEFYGGHPMGTKMYDVHEIEGENVWVVNLKANLYSYLKKKGNIGDLEDLYSQIGGLPEHIEMQINEDQLQKDKRPIGTVIVDTINKLLFLDDNNIYEKEDKKKKFEEENSHIFNNTRQVHTHYDGNTYYTFLNIFKDGKFLEKRKISSLKNPITWKYILSEIMRLNNFKRYYGFVYKLSYSWDKGYILETTDDIRYYVNYKCNN